MPGRQLLPPRRPSALVAAALLVGLSACGGAGSSGGGAQSTPSSCSTGGACDVASSSPAGPQPSSCSNRGTGRTDDFREPVTLTRQPDGLEVGDVVPGTGRVIERGQTIGGVQYTLWLSNGTKIQSSRDPGSPPLGAFTIGQGGVIKGWDEGLVGMRVGSVRRLVVPPELGYGPSSPPGSGIPPNATLVFDVEVLCAG